MMNHWSRQFNGQQGQLLTDKEIGHFWLGLACIFFVLAVFEYFSPSGGGDSGRWAWLHTMTFRVFGESGKLILYSVLGALSAAYGAYKYCAKRN